MVGVPARREQVAYATRRGLFLHADEGGTFDARLPLGEGGPR